jgi:hypothetical protein
MADVPIPDVTPPDLTQAWDTYGPAPTGHPRNLGGGPGASGPELTGPPEVRAYMVSPGSVVAATHPILGHTQAAVADYEAIKSYTAEVNSWIYLQRGPEVAGWQDSSGGGWGDPIAVYPHVKSDYENQWAAAVKDVAAASDNLLLQVADAITLAGHFVDAVNNAAQFYSKADQDSFLPTLPVETGK